MFSCLMFFSPANFWLQVTGEKRSHLLTLLCYQINRRQTGFIRVNTDLVKAVSLLWWSEKQMRWRNWWAEFCQEPFAVWPQGQLDTDCAGGDACVCVSGRGVRRPPNYKFCCQHMGWGMSIRTNTVCVPPPPLHSKFCLPANEACSTDARSLHHSAQRYISHSKGEGATHAKINTRARPFLHVGKCHSQTFIDLPKI